MDVITLASLNNTAIVSRYFEWLCDKINAREGYSKLLWKLHSLQFRWSISNDDNRAIDGKILRDKFANDCGIADYSALNGPCSVLEMLVGLAIRCENDIMNIWENGDNTAFWFWQMIENCGLFEATDDNFDDILVEVTIDSILDREYNSSGIGGFFPLKNAQEDQREVEIWYQMSFWLEENYPIEDEF